MIPGTALGEEIGRGGFGVVHRGSDTATGEPVAVKILHRVLDPRAAAAFANEVQVMGTLAWHPGIVRIRAAGEIDGQPYLVMEHLGRGSLGSRLRADGPLPWQAVTAAGVQAATALQVAHNAGLLHRDIKPDNLLVADDGAVKLSDFGVVLAAGDARRRRGATGTVAYSAPELLAGQPASVASDVYALGATLYALLSGQPAFHRDTDESPAAMILRAHRDPVPVLADPPVPAAVARVIARAMAKDPADRPSSAEHLVRELQQARDEAGLAPLAVVPAGQPAQAAAPAAAGLPDQPSPEARAKARRWQRLGAVGAAAAALLAVTVVATGTFLGGGDDDVAGSADTAGEEVFEEPADQAEEADEPAEVEPPPEEEPGEGVLPAPSPTPAAPPPPPAAPPPVPEGFVPLPGEALALTSTGVVDPPTVLAVTSDGVVATDGTTTTAVPLDGAVDVAATGGGVAVATSDGPLRLLRLDGVELAPLGEVPAIVAAEVVAVGDGFWAATPDGLVRLGADGSLGPDVALSDASHVAAGGQQVWAANDAGQLVAITPEGRPRSSVTVPATGLRELVVDDRGRAVVVTDRGVVRVAVDGTVTELAARADVADVAIAGGRVLLLIDGAVTTVDAQPGEPPVLDAVVLLDQGGVAAVGPPALAGLVDPPGAVPLR